MATEYRQGEPPRKVPDPPKDTVVIPPEAAPGPARDSKKRTAKNKARTSESK